MITGGSGFVGTHLTAHLAQMGDEATAVDREHDVTDVDAMAKVVGASAPEVIFHLAGLSHVGESWSDPSEVLRVNVLGTACVLAAARRAAPEAVVMVVSSAEAYGLVTEAELPLTERSAVRPTSPYAASKAAAEIVALQAWRGFGQRVIVVRPFNHIGPGQAETFFVPALAKRLVEARAAGVTAIAVGSLKARRDFTDVRDVVAAYRLLALAKPVGEVFNVCSGVDVSVAEVANRLRGLAHPEARFFEDPALLRPVDIPILRGDASALRAATGWQPSVDLDTTLRDVVDEAVARAAAQSR